MNRPISLRDVGFRIRQLRESFGYSQEKLAEMAEISPRYMTSLENGGKNMTITKLAGLADALHVSADYLLFGSDDRTDPSPLYEILSNLSPKEMDHARELLLLFVKATTDHNLAATPEALEKEPEKE